MLCYEEEKKILSVKNVQTLTLECTNVFLKYLVWTSLHLVPRLLKMEKVRAQHPRRPQILLRISFKHLKLESVLSAWRKR